MYKISDFSCYYVVNNNSLISVFNQVWQHNTFLIVLSVCIVVFYLCSNIFVVCTDKQEKETSTLKFTIINFNLHVLVIKIKYSNTFLIEFFLCNRVILTKSYTLFVMNSSSNKMSTTYFLETQV